MCSHHSTHKLSTYKNAPIRVHLKYGSCKQMWDDTSTHVYEIISSSCSITSPHMDTIISLTQRRTICCHQRHMNLRMLEIQIARSLLLHIYISCMQSVTHPRWKGQHDQHKTLRKNWAYSLPSSIQEPVCHSRELLANLLDVSTMALKLRGAMQLWTFEIPAFHVFSSNCGCKDEKQASSTHDKYTKFYIAFLISNCKPPV